MADDLPKPLDRLLIVFKTLPDNDAPVTGPRLERIPKISAVMAGE